MPDIVLDYHRKKIPIDHPPYFGADVGIGTTTPKSKLHVEGDVNLGLFSTETGEPRALYVYSYKGTTSQYGMHLGWNSATGRWRTRIFAPSPNRDIAFAFQSENLTNPVQSDWSEKMVIRDNGNVGIGRTDPPNILSVQQNSPTDPIADAWTVYSTPKTKNIEKALDELDLKKALEDFKKIPVYSWTRPKVGAKKIPSRLSAIAEAGVPEAILSYDAEGNVQGLDLLGYVGFLHAVVRAQQSAIDELRAEVNELKAKIG